MSLEFLRQVAASPLPKHFHASKDLAAVRILRQAGLVLALESESPERGARVLAITEKGRQELLGFHYPDPLRTLEPPPNWFHVAARRARATLRPGGARDLA